MAYARIDPDNATTKNSDNESSIFSEGHKLSEKSEAEAMQLVPSTSSDPQWLLPSCIMMSTGTALPMLLLPPTNPGSLAGLVCGAAIPFFLLTGLSVAIQGLFESAKLPKYGVFTNVMALGVVLAISASYLPVPANPMLMATLAGVVMYGAAVAAMSLFVLIKESRDVKQSDDIKASVIAPVM